MTGMAEFKDVKQGHAGTVKGETFAEMQARLLRESQNKKRTPVTTKGK